MPTSLKLPAEVIESCAVTGRDIKAVTNFISPVSLQAGTTAIKEVIMKIM